MGRTIATGAFSWPENHTELRSLNSKKDFVKPDNGMFCKDFSPDNNLWWHELVGILLLDKSKSSLEKERLIEQIQKYKNLPVNWASSDLPNSKTKKQITSKTIEHAKVFIEHLADKAIKNIEIYPRGYDGISFVWKKKTEDKYLEVTITSEGHLSYFLEEGEEFILSDDNDELETFEKFPQLEKLLINMS